MNLINKPYPNSYWVIPRKLLAGEYPGDTNPVDALEKLNKLAACGVSHFIDLTTPYDGLLPYQPLLGQITHPNHNITYQHFPILDLGVPKDKADMVRILDAIDQALSQGRTVYVHCWGGIGRTGITVGCYLSRRGHHGQAALAELRRLWQDCAKSARHGSPETEIQRRYIAEWTE